MISVTVFTLQPFARDCDDRIVMLSGVVANALSKFIYEIPGAENRCHEHQTADRAIAVAIATSKCIHLSSGQ